MHDQEVDWRGLTLRELEQMRDLNSAALERAFAEVVRLESLIAFERRRLTAIDAEPEGGAQSAG